MPPLWRSPLKVVFGALSIQRAGPTWDLALSAGNLLHDWQPFALEAGYPPVESVGPGVLALLECRADCNGGLSDAH